MSRLTLLIKIQDCEMGVTRLVFELLAGHTVAKVTYCFMIGQFNYTMIKASTDRSGYYDSLKVFESAGNLSTSNELYDGIEYGNVNPLSN